MVSAVVEVREENPAWGGRKIHHYLRARGWIGVPHANTITGILRRHGLLDPDETNKHKAFKRFERALPNELWQMDFKGHFALAGGRCHPLSVLDDHSRFAVALGACGDERRVTVQRVLRDSFRRYGLPEWMLVDNGPPWGTAYGVPHTRLTAWLMRLGIGISHGRPFHPQTQGKTERFNRTLKAELLAGRRFAGLDQTQRAFDQWRHRFNYDNNISRIMENVVTRFLDPAPFPEPA